MNDEDPEVTRRAVLAAGVAATAVSRSARQPVVFLPHGGGPWPFISTPMGPPEELEPLADYLRGLSKVPVGALKAVLVVSAHWEEAVPTVQSSARPPMLYDYSGFPEESYRITWPSPGAPALAARVRQLLKGAGFASGEDAERGYDHGAFVPLKLTWPKADVPTLQLSLKAGLDPAEHLAIGRALQPLRDEGVFIVGSGMSYHNMRGFFDARARPAAATFDAWLQAATTSAPSERDAQLTAWAKAPAARQAHPREEHLLPLMVVAGAAGADRGRVGYEGTLMGLKLSAFHFG